MRALDRAAEKVFPRDARRVRSKFLRATGDPRNPWGHESGAANNSRPDKVVLAATAGTLWDQIHQALPNKNRGDQPLARLARETGSRPPAAAPHTSPVHPCHRPARTQLFGVRQFLRQPSTNRDTPPQLRTVLQQKRMPCALVNSPPIRCDDLPEKCERRARPPRIARPW